MKLSSGYLAERIIVQRKKEREKNGLPCQNMHENLNELTATEFAQSSVKFNIDLKC